MRTEPSGLALQSLRLQFFDVPVRLQTDSLAYLDLFTRMYGSFLVPEQESEPGQPLTFTLLTNPDNYPIGPALIYDGELHCLEEPWLAGGYPYQLIRNSIIARVRSHFLIHAGAVSHQGRGVLLAADSGHGKTTLVLALVRRGFKFLSDELAALGRADCCVYPFSRLVNVRPGTLGLAGFPPQSFEAPHWGEKALLDIESIQPGSLGQPARLSHVIVLNGAGEPAGQPSHPAEPDLEVLVTRLDEGLLDGLRDLELVEDLKIARDRGYPCLQVRTSRRTETLGRIQALCREQRVRVLDMTKRFTRHPSFDGPAHLEPLSTSETVLELLRRFQGGHQAALLQDEFAGSAVRLYRELAAGISGAECYRLTSGPLNRMAGLVAELVEAS